MSDFVMIEGCPAKVLSKSGGVLFVRFEEGGQSSFSARDVEEIDDPAEIARLEEHFS